MLTYPAQLLPRDRLSRFLAFARRESARVKERSLGGWEKRARSIGLSSASANDRFPYSCRDHMIPKNKIYSDFSLQPRPPLALSRPLLECAMQ